MLKDKIEKNMAYFQSMEITNNTLIVKVQYPDKWGVFPSEDSKIKVAQAEQEKNVWFYYANKDDADFESIFDLIDTTIQTNEAAMAKLNLLNEKFEELKNIFATESLENLKGLKFVFGKRKKRTVKQDSQDVVNNSDETKIIES